MPFNLNKFMVMEVPNY